MTSPEWRAFIEQEHMQRRATSKFKMRDVFPVLFEMFTQQHPRARKSRVRTMDALLDCWRRGMSNAEWASAARQRLGLRLEDEESNVVQLRPTGDGD